MLSPVVSWAEKMGMLHRDVVAHAIHLDVPRLLIIAAQHEQSGTGGASRTVLC